MAEPMQISLHVEASDESSLTGDLELTLLKTLRVLAGRREVWLAETAKGARRVIAKKFLPGDKQAKESRREIYGLRELAKRGILGPKLLCVARDDSENIWVVTELIDSAVDLAEVIAKCARAESSDTAITSFAATLVQHWRKGVLQTDVHNRNYLWDGQQIYTIDVGSIRFLEQETPRRMCIDTLERTCFKLSPYQWSLFLEELTRQTDREIVDYVRSDDFQRQMERRIRKELRRVWLKSQRESSDTRVIQRRGVKLYSLPDADPSLIEQVLSAPDALMEQGERLKSGNTCTVQRIEWGGRQYVVKRYNRKPFFYRLRHVASTTRVVQSWGNAKVLDRFRIQTPAAVIACELRKYGLPDRGFLVMKHVEGATLNDYMSRPDISKNERMKYVAEAGELFQNLYKFRIVHGDMKAKNLLVGAEQLWLIDIDGMKITLEGTSFERYFEKDRRRFLRNWESQPTLQAAFEGAIRAD